MSTNTGGQPVVVQPKEGLEPKSSLGTLLARFHSRENNFFRYIKSYVFFSHVLFHASLARSVQRERDRERETHEFSYGGDDEGKDRISNFHALMSLYAIYSNIGVR